MVSVPWGSVSDRSLVEPDHSVRQFPALNHRFVPHLPKSGRLSDTQPDYQTWPSDPYAPFTPFYWDMRWWRPAPCKGHLGRRHVTEVTTYLRITCWARSKLSDFSTLAMQDTMLGSGQGHDGAKACLNAAGSTPGPVAHSRP